MKSLSVAIVADNASTAFGGESLIPYQYFCLLRKRGIDTWLCVHERCAKELLELLPDAKGRMVFLEDSRFELYLYQLENVEWLKYLSKPLSFVRQLSFNWRQRTQVKKLVKEQEITLLHQPIPVSPKQPSFLFNMGVPVMIGPMNGGMEIPRGMHDFQGPLARFAVRCGRRIAALLNFFIPGKKKAALLLAANERTYLALPSHEGRVEIMSENGVDADLPPSTPHEGPVAYIFVGRLIELKGVHYLIEAFQKICKQFPCRLHIVGDGPERSKLEDLAKHTPNIIFHGQLPWKNCLKEIQESDVMIFPSMMDCGGAAVLEGMAYGKPVIATDWGGPPDYIDSQTGILISPLNDQQYIHDLSAAMEKLGNDRALREKMGQRGVTKVLHDYTWEAKIEKILNFYQQLVGIHK